MRCPYCSSTESQVKDSRPDIEDSAIRRRRVCSECGAKFTTIERVQMRDLMVRKSGGNIEPFDREKLGQSIRRACSKRGIADEKIEKLITGIHRRLETDSSDSVINTSLIGEIVSESLLNLDHVAFIRFVSVYRNFTKISDFKKIIGKIPEVDENSEICELPPKQTLF